MTLKALLQHFTSKWGLKELPLEKDGVARLVYDPSLILNFEPSLDNQGFFLYSSLGTVASQEEKLFFQEALTGNLFGSQTGKGCLGYLPSAHLLIYFAYYDLTFLAEAAFEEEVEQFCQYHFYWVEKLEQLRKQKPLYLEDPMKGLQEKGKLKIFFA